MTPSQSTELGSTNPFKCPDCGKTYRQRSELYIHQTVHIGKVPLSCKTCKKEFSDAFTLDLHQRKSFCQLKDARRQVCTICQRSYHCASTLALHQRVHFIPRPFACTFCTAAFSTRRTLTRHLQAHNHWEIPRCFLCGLVFSQRSTLRTHEFLLRCVYPHNCNVCGQKFMLGAQLRQHKKRHKTMLHGPFKCGICDKEFFLRKTLIVHWRRHMAGPTFSCHLCPKAFYLKTRLASHLRLHVFTDVSEEWRMKKTKEKMDVDNAQCGPHSEDDSQLKASEYWEAIPLEVITSRKGTSDDTEGTKRIYHCIASGTNDNIYVEVGDENMPGVGPPQEESGNMEDVPLVKDIVKKTARDAVMDKEKAVVASKEKAVAAPKEKAVAASKEKAIAASKEKAVAASKEKAVAAPKEKAVAAPKEKAVAAPKEKAVATSKEKAVAASKEKAVVVSPSATEPVSFHCNICKKSFAKNTSLKVHQKSHHSTTVGSSSTSGEVASSTNVATREALPKQQNFGPFPYCNSSVKIIVACSRCGERNFKSLEELEQHVCSELKDKNHTCHICGKQFKFRCRLTTHILKHQHVKPCRVPCL